MTIETKEHTVPRTKQDLLELKSKGLQHFVFKANIPLNDVEEIFDWTVSCQDKSPMGFDDYRWGKMLHDHKFAKNLGKELEAVKTKQDDIVKLLQDIVQSLKTKNKKELHSDLFK